METAYYLLLHLVAAHVFADFMLQPKSLVALKTRKPIVGNVLHTAIVASLTWLIAGMWSNWQLVIAISVVHLLTDMGKHALRDLAKKHQLTLFLGDQAIHLLSIYGISLWLTDTSATTSMTWYTLWGTSYTATLIFLAGIIVVTQVAGIVIGMLVQPYLSQLRLQEGERGLEGGGMVIGTLERGMIFIFIIASAWEGVGFLLAAKSIFRFGDLTKGEDRKQTEYVIIGTLMSFFIAIMIAAGAKELLMILQ